MNHVSTDSKTVDTGLQMQKKILIKGLPWLNIALILLLSMLTLNVLADSALKIGVVNIQELLEGLSKALTSPSQNGQSIALAKELNAIQAQEKVLDKQIGILEKKMLYAASVETRARQMAELKMKQLEIEKIRSQRTAKFVSYTDKVKKELVRLRSTVQKYAKENDFDVVYDKQGKYAVYQKQVIDITAEVNAMYIRDTQTH